MDEVAFVAEVKSWIDAFCSKNPNLLFSRAEIEKRKLGRRERRDLVIFTRDNKIALSGEVKLPDQPEGKSPYSEALVLDAHNKANAVGAPYFFTWNINRFVLWETFQRGTPIIQRSLDYFDWAEIHDSSDLDRADVQDKIREKVKEFLDYFEPIHEGSRPFPRKPLDQWFIHLLESALDAPWRIAHNAIHKRYKANSDFRRHLNDWVRAHLGAIISEEYEEENLIRAAKFSCYVIANKVVFYDALRRRYNGLLALSVPNTAKTASDVYRRLARAFRKAERISGDYETVFQGDPFGERLPFLDDHCVDAWRELAQGVDAYDFTSIDYDIIGKIFDRLIGPDERHRFGQHFTKSEVVDIINAFCIRSAKAHVLDPACGGGTFLVRAYARKKWLAARSKEKISHEELISGIYGVDISTYATHLSTVSLATRELVRAPNYPRIACEDFFEVRRGRAIFPAGEGGRGNVPLGELDCVVGNPPYIRQEDIPAEQKARIRQLCEDAWQGIRFSGRSDIHVYFWPYASSFFGSEGGYFGFLTSSSWLDVEYGFHLQRWILQNFRVVSILESSSEPLFTDARVNTAITIMRKEPNADSRDSNLVRFVQVRRPLADILLDFERGGDRLGAAQAVSDFIEGQTQNHEDSNWRIRVVRQSELISNGLSAIEHEGAKWGIYLRAPDIFFELKKRCGERLVKLEEISKIKFGLKSGCDKFFFPRDITDDEVLQDLSDKELADRYGVRRRDTDRIRICKAGDGSVHLIESEYLEPEVHSLMEVQSIEIEPGDLKRKVLLVSQPKSALRRTHALRYIQWGERQDFDKGTTCASREPSRRWYDLALNDRSDFFWPMIQKYRHVIPLNTHRYICNHNLFDCYAEDGIDAEILCATLNSTIVAFVKNFYGRWAGTEGTLKTEVIDVERLPVPNPSNFSDAVNGRISSAFEALRKRPVLHLREELTQPDRRGLDLAVLVGLGFDDSEAKVFLERLYSCVEELYSGYRAIELQANANRARAARRGRSTPQSIGAEVWETLADDGVELRAFPKEFLPPNVQAQVMKVPEGKARYAEDLFDGKVVEVGTTRIRIGDRDRALYLLALIEEGHRSAVSVPVDPSACREAVEEWRRYREELYSRFEELAASRTADARVQERIVRDLWRRYRAWCSEQT